MIIKLTVEITRSRKKNNKKSPGKVGQAPSQSQNKINLVQIIHPNK